MTEENIRNLLSSLINGLIVLIISILLHQLGSKKAFPQTISFFGCVFGIVFIVSSGYRMIEFRKYFINLNKK